MVSANRLPISKSYGIWMDGWRLLRGARLSIIVVVITFLFFNFVPALMLEGVQRVISMYFGAQMEAKGLLDIFRWSYEGVASLIIAYFWTAGFAGVICVFHHWLYNKELKFEKIFNGFAMTLFKPLLPIVLIDGILTFGSQWMDSVASSEDLTDLWVFVVIFLLVKIILVTILSLTVPLIVIKKESFINGFSAAAAGAFKNLHFYITYCIVMVLAIIFTLGLATIGIAYMGLWINYLTYNYMFEESRWSGEITEDRA